MAAYDIDRIIDFMSRELKDEYRAFSQYYAGHAERDLGKDARYRGVAYWSGADPFVQAQSLIGQLDTAGYFHELPYYLCHYWLKGKEGNKAVLSKFGMDQDLCLAAQEMWNWPFPIVTRPPDEEELLRQRLAFSAFDLLAQINPAFAVAWNQTPWSTADPDSSLPLPHLPGSQSVSELTNHLETCRAFYIEATEQHEQHEWVKARLSYLQLDQLQRGYSDASIWADCLSDPEPAALLQTIVQGMLKGFYYDDRLPWQLYPYRSPEVPISPWMSNSQIAETLTRFGDEMPDLPDARYKQWANLEMLTKDDTRLFVDAFLYPDYFSPDDITVLENLFIDGGCRLPDLKTLRSGMREEIIPLILILAGDPQAAAANWMDIQDVDPGHNGAAHCQALLNLALACDKHNQADLKLVIGCWKRAISQWAMALIEPPYWIWLCNNRKDQDGSPIYGELSAHQVLNLRQRVRTFLGEVLRQKQEEWAGNPNIARQFEQLYLDLLIEFRAIDLLKNLGGIALDEDGIIYSWFGPLWMEQFGWQNHLTRCLKNFQPDPFMLSQLPGSPSVEQVERQLFWYFSQLKYALAYFEPPIKEAQRALDILDSLEESLNAGDFDRLNPPYTIFADGQKEFLAEICSLKIDVYLHIAEDMIDGVKVKNRETLLTAWTKALKLVEGKPREELSTRIQAELLTKITPTKNLSVEGISNAIQLFQIARRAGLDSPRFSHKQVELYVLRAQHNMDTLSPDWTEAEADFQAALELEPDRVEVKHALAVAWYSLSIEIAFEDRFQAQEYLRKAKNLLLEINENDKYNELITTIDNWWHQLRTGQRLPSTKTQANPPDLAPLVAGELTEDAKLIGKAEFQLRARQYDNALSTLDQALKLDIDGKDTAIIERLAGDVLVNAANDLYLSGKLDEAEALFSHWYELLESQQEKLDKQFSFLRYWPQLREALSEIKTTDRVIDFQKVAVWFAAHNAEPEQIFYLTTDGDYLYIYAEFLFVDADLAKMIPNLLHVSAHTILFKISQPDDMGLRFEANIPQRMISGAWLNRILVTLAAYMDVPANRLDNLSQLVPWYEQTRTQFTQPDENLVGNNVSQSVSFLESWCKENIDKAKYQRKGSAQALINLPDGLHVEMHAWLDGVRLSCEVGEAVDPRLIAATNAKLQQGKLYLDGARVRLSIEVPYMDRPEVRQVFVALPELYKFATAQLYK